MVDRLRRVRYNLAMRPGAFCGAGRGRRRLVVLGLALGVSALALPAAALTRPAATLPSAIGKGEGALSLLTLPGYAEQKWVTPFEKQTGCKVRVARVSTADELTTRMSGGGKGFDLAAVSGDASLELVQDKDVAPVNVKLIDSWKDFQTAFQSPPTNTVRGKHYGISAQFAPTTLLYNAKKMVRPTSWAVLYSVKRRGAITVPNEPMFIADAALYLSKTKPALGIKDPYELSKRQFAAVVTLLRSQRPLVTAYWTTASDEIELFSSGRSSVGAAWPYQQATLLKAGMKVAVGAPREGTTGWLDSWMLSASARHPNCAYRWLNWVSSPQLQAEQATFYGATPVNKKACPLMDKLEKNSCAAYRADAGEAYYRSIRFWKTPLADCGDGRGKLCVPYATWVRAWAQITK